MPDILDDLMDPTPWGQRGKRRQTAEDRIAAMLLKQGTDSSAVGHWTQGAARAMSAAAGVIREKRADRRAQEGALENQRVIQALIGNTGNVPPQGPETNPISQPQGPSVIPAPQVSAAPEQVIQPQQPTFAPPPSFADGPDGEAMPAFSVAPEIPQQQPPITIAPPEQQNSAVVNPPQPVEQPQQSGFTPNARQLNLSSDDIKNIKKTLTTEVVAGLQPDPYNAQAAGIIDTINNRVVQGDWGPNVKSVVNARSQFSDVNGPPAWKKGRTGVDMISDALLNTPAGKRASQFADSYLAKRSGNAAPASPMENQGSQHFGQIAGGHLNYANPHYSDAVNLPWINALKGPVLGAGNAIHRHGTTAPRREIDPTYAVNLTGQPQIAQSQPIAQAAQGFRDVPMDVAGVNPQATPEMNAEALMQQQPELPQQPYQVASLGPDVPMPMPPQTTAALPPEAMPPQPPSPAPEQLAQVNALGTPPSPNDFGFRAPASTQQAQAPVPSQAQPSAEQRIVQSIAQAPQQQQKPINPAIIRALTSGDPTAAAIGKIYLQKHLAENAPQKPKMETKVLPNGDVVVVDENALKAHPVYNAPKTQFGVIGKDQFGRDQYGFINPNKNEVNPYQPPQAQPQGPSTIPPVPAGVDPKLWNEMHSKNAATAAIGPTNDEVKTLRGEIRDLPSYKNMAVVIPKYNAMVKSAANDNRASDLSLVYSFMKLLDPGSVVRESEISMAQQVPTLPQQYQNQIKSFLTGQGRLPPEVRQQLMGEANIAVQEYRNAWDNDLKLYKGVIQRRKMNEADVYQDFEPIQKFTPQNANTPVDPATVPAGVDANLWKYMTPEQRKLWQKN